MVLRAMFCTNRCTVSLSGLIRQNMYCIHAVINAIVGFLCFLSLFLLIFYLLIVLIAFLYFLHFQKCMYYYTWRWN